MSSEMRSVYTINGWFVETALGMMGPMDSQLEAEQYISLMLAANMARAEMACTDNECFG